jgi:hypothetical protein
MQPPIADSGSRSIVLVLLETGARLVESIAHASKDGPELVVVAQDRADGAADFGARAQRRIAELERSGRAASRAVVAVGSDSADATGAARFVAARAALRHLLKSGQGLLVLQAGESASATLRHQLLALAGTLMAEIAGANVVVRVRFGRPSHDLLEVLDCGGAALATAV